MQLTTEQIQNLYQFTKKHFVEWYDVQTELVDHLANDIENILKENPNLNFYQARDKAFKKFGVFGFMEVVEQKHKQLNKYYWKLILKEFKAFFNIPKIAVAISVFYAIYYLLFHFKINRTVFFTAMILISVFPLIYLFKFRKKLQEKVKTTGKKYLFEENIANLGGIAGAVTLPLQITLQAQNIYNQTTAIWLSLFITVYVLYLYISVFEMPKKIRKIIKKNHPDYKIV